MKRLICMLLAFLSLLGVSGCQKQDDTRKAQPITSAIVAEKENYKFHGKAIVYDDGLACDETATGISFHGYFEGAVTVELTVNANTYFGVYIDGQIANDRLLVDSLTKSIEIANFTEPGEHTIELIKQTEACKSICLLKSVSFTGYFLAPPAEKQYCIAYIGDSITAGYGVYYDPQQAGDAGDTQYQDGTKTYAYLSAEKLNADPIIICRSGIGISAGHTDYMMDAYFSSQSYCRADTAKYTPTRLPDIVVVNLGTNDAMGSNEALASKLPGFIELIRETYGEEVPIIWVYGMMNDARWEATNKVLQNQFGGEAGGCYGLKMPLTRDGGNNHPSLTAHANAADILVKFIQEKNLLQ